MMKWRGIRFISSFKNSSFRHYSPLGVKLNAQSGSAFTCFVQRNLWTENIKIYSAVGNSYKISIFRERVQCCNHWYQVKHGTIIILDTLINFNQHFPTYRNLSLEKKWILQFGCSRRRHWHCCLPIFLEHNYKKRTRGQICLVVFMWKKI